MHLVRFSFSALVLVGLSGLGGAHESPKGVTLQAADDLFRHGQFADAEALYSQLATGKTADSLVALRLGSIALYQNRLDVAEVRLKQVLRLKPDDREAKRLLAEVYYRRDDFAKAAPLFRTSGNEVLAKKLEGFKDARPYLIESQAEVTHVWFLQTDPLPLIEVKVNGEPLNFLIDTGASEVYLDPAVVKKLAVRQFGTTQGEFAGGKSAQTGHGRIDSLTLGDFVVRNVPVLILSTKRFAAMAQGRSVGGILGTAILFRFIAALDYPRGELVLRRKTRGQLKQVEEQTKAHRGIVMPFWMAGDHFLVAWGKVEKSPPLLFFVDTGLAGGGFICPSSTLKDAAIATPVGPAMEGQGGGGKLKLVPFMVDELSLGEVKGRQIQAFAGVFPPGLEYSLGFRIAGIISHQFFRPYSLTFDFQEMRLLVTPGQR